MNETVQCITSDGRAVNDIVNGGVARVSEKGVVRAITYRTLGYNIKGVVF